MTESTRNLLKRKSMHLECYDCVFCNERSEETSLHLFRDCTYAQDCWASIIPNRLRGTYTFDDTMLALDKFPRAIALDIIMLSYWNIWIQRNGKVFRKEAHCLDTWKYLLKKDLALLEHRVKQKNLSIFKNWIDSNL